MKQEELKTTLENVARETAQVLNRGLGKLPDELRGKVKGAIFNGPGETSGKNATVRLSLPDIRGFEVQSEGGE